MFIADNIKTKKKNLAAPQDEISFSSYGEAHRLKQDLEKLNEQERASEQKIFYHGGEDDGGDDDGDDDDREGNSALQRPTRSERHRRSSLALRSGSIFVNKKGSSFSQKERIGRRRGAISVHPLGGTQGRDRKPPKSSNPIDDGHDDEKNELAALSTLDAHTVRWLNRRKTVKGPLAAFYKYQTTLANALPYKPIFRGLDTADEGDIELADIEDVIKKLSKPPRPGEERLFDDPKAILNFFREMDTDGGGTVDFGEFAIGMTNCPGGKEANGVVRLQEAFMKYSSDIQRLAILKRATNPTVSDLDRFNAMKKLFEVAVTDNQDIEGVTTEDVTRNAYRRFEKTQQEVREQIRDQRHKDFERARTARVFFDYEKKGTLFGTAKPTGTGTRVADTLPFVTSEAVAYMLSDGDGRTASAPLSRDQHQHRKTTSSSSRPGRTTSRHSSRAVSRCGPVLDPVLADLRDPDEVVRKIAKKLSHRLGKLPLPEKYLTTPPATAVLGTFGTQSNDAPTYSDVRLQARREARTVNHCATGLLPPPTTAGRRNTVLIPLIKTTSTS